MDIDPNDLLIFARVAESGSFSRAAEHVGLPKSTVSRRIAELERRLGERVITRTTRKLALTEFGAGLLEHARQVAEQVEAASSLAQHRQARPSGRLRVSAPGDVATLALADPIAGFIERYPDVVLELDLSPRRVDLIAERFDVAIRMGVLPDDSTLAARRIASFTSGLYASPSYVARRGVPETPADLASHDILGMLGRGETVAQWTLTRAGSRWEGSLPARSLANSPEWLNRLARAGAGIAASVDRFAAPYVARRELVRVLPEWRLPAVDAWAVFPGRRLMPARTRVFLEALDAAFRADERGAGRQGPR